ncbi:HEAT repeat domain-containing protein, partial [Elusimicrobiota bacterium]
RIRGAAARALGRIGGEKEVEKLIQKAGKDDSAEVRQSAVEALENLTLRGNSGEKRTDIEKAIKSSKKDKNKKVKEAAQKAQGRLDKMGGKGKKK